MNKYGKIIERVLKMATKKAINESRLQYAGKERMHPSVEEALREGKTSLGEN